MNTTTDGYRRLREIARRAMSERGLEPDFPPAALRQLGSAKDKIAHQSIERLATVLDMFKLDVGRYPTTEQGLQALITPPTGLSRWAGPYLKGDKLPEDPWGHPFVYHSPSQRPNHEFDLYSLGPNGQAAGPGDASAIYKE